MAVNWDIVKGNWKQFKGEARKQWGDITDDEWEQMAGEKDKLVGTLQEKYGWEKEEAERRAEESSDRWQSESDL